MGVKTLYITKFKNSLQMPKRSATAKKSAPKTKKTKKTRVIKKVPKVKAPSKPETKKAKSTAPKYNIWRKKSVYGPMYRRLESFKQKQMHEEEKEKAKERINREKKNEQKEKEKIRKAEEKKIKMEKKKLDAKERRLRNELAELKSRRKSLDKGSKKTSKSRRKKIQIESELDDSFSEEEIVSDEIEEESFRESSSIEIKNRKKGSSKKTPREVYIYKNGKLIPLEIKRQDTKSLKKSRKQTALTKKMAQKQSLKKLTEQQKRIDAIEVHKQRYCLVDYWEDSNEKIDKKRNKKKGKILSTRGNRPGTYNFSLKKTATNAEYRITIDQSLIISCNCLDWKTTCCSLEIMCKHMYYVMRHILKYPITDIRDSQIQDRVLFFNNLEFIKLDYYDETAKVNAGTHKCVICYGDLMVKSGWTWRPDPYNSVTCPDCGKSIHRDCAEVWLKKSDNKNCVFCRSKRFKQVL